MRHLDPVGRDPHLAATMAGRVESSRNQLDAFLGASVSLEPRLASPWVVSQEADRHLSVAEVNAICEIRAATVGSRPGSKELGFP